MTDELTPCLCSNCTYGFLGLTGVFCTMFNQPVEDTVAPDCSEFEPVALPDVIVTVNGQQVSSTVEEVPAPWAESHSDHQLSDDELVAACDRWLAERHVTLWGQHFEVISPAGRGLAAAWLAAQIRSLDASLLRDEE